MESHKAWSESRKRIAEGTASVLYGVIGIMTADLAYEPGSVPKYAVAAGALLVGLAMALTPKKMIITNHIPLECCTGLEKGIDWIALL